MQKKSLLGSVLTAMFTIVAYLTYIHTLLNQSDSVYICAAALVYMFPLFISLIEEVTVSPGKGVGRFIFDIVCIVIEAVYVGMLWYFISMWGKNFIAEICVPLKYVMVTLPAVFSLRFICETFEAFMQLWNKKKAAG